MPVEMLFQMISALMQDFIRGRPCLPAWVICTRQERDCECQCCAVMRTSWGALLLVNTFADAQRAYCTSAWEGRPCQGSLQRGCRLFRACQGSLQRCCCYLGTARGRCSGAAASLGADRGRCNGAAACLGPARGRCSGAAAFCEGVAAHELECVALYQRSNAVHRATASTEVYIAWGA